MQNISYKERSAQKTAKGKLLPFGIVMGSLTLLALIAGIGLFILYPLVIDTSLSSIVDYVKAFFPVANVSVGEWALLVVQALILLGGITFAIYKIVKMFSSKTIRSANKSVGLTAGFGIFFFAFSCELVKLIGNTSNLGDLFFIYSFVCVFGLSIINDIVTAVYARKFWEKSQTKINAIPILTIIACLVAIAGGIFVLDITTFKFYTNFTTYETLLGVNYIISFAQGVELLADGTLGALEFIFGELSIITTCAMLVLAGKLVISFIFDFFKIGADKNYLRGSNYFNKTSALRTAGAFTFTLFFSIILVVLDQLIIDKEDILVILTNSSIYAQLTYYGSIFVVVLVLSIICASIASKDKKKANDEEYSYNDEVEEPTAIEEPVEEEVIDLTEEPIEEQIVAVEEEPLEKAIEEIEEQPQPEPEVIPVIPVVEEVVEEKVAEPIKEEIKVEEPIKEEVLEEPKAKEEPAQQQGYPQYPYGMPYPYAPYPQYPPYPPYPQYPVMPMPMPMPYPYAQPMPYQVQQPAPAQPTVICIPIQQPAPAQAPAPVQYQYVQPQQAPVAPAPAPAPATPEQPAPAPVKEEVVATEDDFNEEVENKPFVIERKTLDEKFNELSPTYKKYYRDIMKYAESKEGVKRNKSTYGDSVTFGRDCIVKIAIKQGKVVCSFSLINYEVKSMLKNGKSAREQLTVVKVVDATSYALAKQSVDMAYKLAIDAKEARHQEQLRKRREARANKAQAK